jgi:hypothetical protein
MHTSNIASEERTRIQQSSGWKNHELNYIRYLLERRKTQLTALPGYYLPATSFCFAASADHQDDEMSPDRH